MTACKSTPAETALMSNTSHECENVFAAVCTLPERAKYASCEKIAMYSRKPHGDYEWFGPKELTVIRNGQIIVMDSQFRKSFRTLKK